ncbi:MAG: V-type ATP synthase subunit I, partial [Dysosmobacter sp.]|nr:V-type ATP synthase subunit I [Dysosmobacter sp.]
MAIVKMKKLRVMAMADSRDALLRELLRLGCVEISEPAGKLSDPAWSALLRRDASTLAQTKNEQGEAAAALEALKRYGGTKDGLFIQRRPVGQEEFLGQAVLEKGRDVSRQINARLQDLSRLQGEEGRLLSRRAGLEPWVPLDMPLECGGTEHAAFRLGVLPGAADPAAIRNELGDAAAELYEISADKQQRCCLLIAHRAEEEKALEILRPHGFSVT